MSSALDAVPGAVLTLSHDLRILAGNRALEDLSGRPVPELLGRSLDVLLSGASRIIFQTHVYPALKADGRVEEVFLTLSVGTGVTTPVLFNAVRSSSDEASTFSALMVRIRARARWESDLLDATRALEQERAASQRLADELTATAETLTARYAEEQRSREFRDAFIGVVSHELRTPITTIYGMSHLLSQRYESLDPDTVRHHLGDIHAEAERLRRLTEDLLVLSRAEGGRLAIEAEPIVIGHVVRNAVESERVRSPGHTFTLQHAAGLPLVLGEELYIEQVVRNFLSNAAKYTPPGTTIHVVVAGEEAGVAVRVIDEGPGLGEEPPERLFDLFYRTTDAMRQASGAGIGLFVCRELIQAMGGRVWAGPVPAPAPHGAEFGFWLPPAADEGDEV
ncbi:MAG TPA: ATP-binding protein [Vitreimonas sp.]|nr:ATP-binding protein [Vitreimonas sp.]